MVKIYVADVFHLGSLMITCLGKSCLCSLQCVSFVTFINFCVFVWELGLDFISS